jgi:hypothetical protein
MIKPRMVLRVLCSTAAAWLLCAAGEPPQPPPALAPYIESGRLQPGDYAWIEGSFADAPPAKKAEFEAIQSWAQGCTDEAKAEVREALAAVGFPAASLEGVALGPLACRQALVLPRHPELTSYARLQEEMALARPVADAFLMAVKLATELGNQGGGGDFARTLAARVQLDQMLGRAKSWGDGAAGAGFPELPPAARAIVLARVDSAYMAQTESETEWLKTAIAQSGWPTESMYGQLPPRQAWLLVQHADHDPLFQLEMLRLMASLAERGEVSKSNHAFLHDRIMLKLAGTQRYGTQAHCVAGDRRPQPLEDESMLATWRAQAELEPEADYIANMNRLFGPCPKPD